MNQHSSWPVQHDLGDVLISGSAEEWEFHFVASEVSVNASSFGEWRPKIQGIVKWDGCCDWAFYHGDEMAHLCKPEHMHWFQRAIDAAYVLAREAGGERFWLPSVAMPPIGEPPVERGTRLY